MIIDVDQDQEICDTDNQQMKWLNRFKSLVNEW